MSHHHQSFHLLLGRYQLQGIHEEVVIVHKLLFSGVAVEHELSDVILEGLAGEMLSEV